MQVSSTALFRVVEVRTLTVISMPAADVDGMVVAEEVRQLLNKHTEVQKIRLAGPRSTGEHQISSGCRSATGPPRSCVVAAGQDPSL